MARQGDLQGREAVTLELEEVYGLGIDLSLQSTGVAVVGITAARVPCILTYTFGRKGKRDEPLLVRHERLKELVGEAVGVIHDHARYPLVACVEDVAFGTPGGSTTDRAGLWWFVVNDLIAAEIPVVAVNVSKVKTYATGRSKGVEKDEVLLSVVRRYPEAPIQNNDEADATVLALMAARLSGNAFDKLPQTHLRAMEGLVLP